MIVKSRPSESGWPDAITPAEKILEALGQAELLFRRDGDGAAKGVDDPKGVDAGVGDALGRELPLVVTEAQTEPRRSSARQCHTGCKRRAARAERPQVEQPPARPVRPW